jgi:transcriptional regulator with XRE-family HTH domain
VRLADIKAHFGDTGQYLRNVRVILATKGIPEAELARRAGVHPSQLSRWIAGKTYPDLESLLKIDEALESL